MQSTNVSEKNKLFKKKERIIKIGVYKLKTRLAEPLKGKKNNEYLYSQVGFVDL